MRTKKVKHRVLRCQLKQIICRWRWRGLKPIKQMMWRQHQAKWIFLQTNSTITVNLGTKTVNLVTKTDNSPIINHQLSFISVKTSDKYANNKSEEKSAKPHKKQLSSDETEECNNIKLRLKIDLQGYKQITWEDLFLDLCLSPQLLLPLEGEEESINSSVQACSKNRYVEERRNSRQQNCSENRTSFTDYDNFVSIDTQ